MSDATRVEEIFIAALERASPTERQEYLREACGDDAALRHRVDRLLAAHRESNHFLETPAIGSVEPAPPLMAGTVLADRYTLVEMIGEGGMGEVWMAEQAAPIRRRVAIKFIKCGMDSEAVLDRFDTERQALSMMDHPNIAHVYDGGITDAGRPYFVMELVKGVSITEFCDARKLTPRQRLELFVPVCRAIQHAHQKGIIHRDIKPDNVQIALYDDVPVPKVIDFGLAKAMGADESAVKATAFGTVVGTPAYMSPEQTMFNNLDIDTRSDIYSLGVLLYELLAGSPPFGEDELRRAGLLEMLRLVREVEPPLPSQKLSSSESLAQLCANRATDPAALSRLLQADLDWIVLKSLDKDRSRRYESAGGFASDIERHLAGRPVEAHPPSGWYQARKFLRRNRPTVVATALILLALVGGTLGTTLGLVESRRQERLTQAALESERSAHEQSLRHLRSFTLAHGALVGVIVDVKRLREASPASVKENLKNLLDDEVRWLDAAGIEDPVILHELRCQLSIAYRLLDLPEDAIAQGRLALRAAEAVHPTGPEAVRSLFELSRSLHDAGQLEEERTLTERAIAIGRALPMPETESDRRNWFLLAKYLHEFGGEPDLAARFVEALWADARSSLGPRHRTTFRYAHQLAWIRMRQGRNDEALALDREAVTGAITEFGLKDAEVSQMLLDSHQLMLNARRTDPVLLAAVKDSIGVDRINDGLLVIEGSDLMKAGRWAEAEAVLRRCVANREKDRPDAWATFKAYSMLGDALLGQKRYAEAEQFLLKGFEGMRARESRIPAEVRFCLRDAVDRLIALAQSLQKSDDVEKWQAVREQYR